MCVSTPVLLKLIQEICTQTKAKTLLEAAQECRSFLERMNMINPRKLKRKSEYGKENDKDSNNSENSQVSDDGYDSYSCDSMKNFTSWDSNEIWGISICHLIVILKQKLEKLKNIDEPFGTNGKLKLTVYQNCETSSLICDIIMLLFNHAVNGGSQVELKSIFPKKAALGRIIINTLELECFSVKALQLKSSNIRATFEKAKSLIVELLINIELVLR